MQREILRAAGGLDVFGRRIHWLETTTSTSDVAAYLAELGVDEGTVVVADAQTAGRGRHGHVWCSPPGAGLYLSIVLRPSGNLLGHANPAALLTLASGVAIAESVRASTGLPAEIKWPNDIMIGRRKLAGILAEATAQSGVLQHVILGIGLNLRQAAFPPEIANRATSVEAETNRAADRAQIFVQVLTAVAARYRDLQAGRFDVILGAWRALAPSLPSSRVEWDSVSGVVRGRAEDVDEQGALVVRVGDRVERIIAGEVRWI
ncbi:MAG: biotin--[acetyl-CoA-carboxylase] ligase [Vicinamibacterales bacterium]|nr:biotin--[acetyl-CoA-carboxylase] ligase [Vicinamibacterales bacterium]